MSDKEKIGAGLPPPPPYYRWTVLIVASLAMAGNYYVYDAISPLADLLRDKLGFTDDQIGMLNAIYSIPNVFMVVIGGLLIDRIGTRKATIIFGTLCFVGAVVTSLSGNFYVMATGRLIFGLGAETLIVAVTAALAKWFRGKELSLAFGLNLTVARLGSFGALNSPTWARAAYGGACHSTPSRCNVWPWVGVYATGQGCMGFCSHWQYPLFIAAGVGVLCILGALAYSAMEKRAERIYSLGEAEEPDKVVFRDIFRFGISYWWVVALCVTFYSAMFPFQTFAVKFFMDVHGVSREGGGGLSSMLTLFAMFCTPLFGYIVDRVGKRSLFMMIGSAMIIPVFLAMAYIPMTSSGDMALGVTTLPRSALIIPMAIMGIAFSLIPAVMWPSVAYLVDQSKIGTALGLMTMIQNIGLAGFNKLIGWANTSWKAGPQNPGGYTWGMWMFSVLGILGVLFAYLLRRAETGPNAQGLETITVKSQREKEKAGEDN